MVAWPVPPSADRRARMKTLGMLRLLRVCLTVKTTGLPGSLQRPSPPAGQNQPMVGTAECSRGLQHHLIRKDTRTSDGNGKILPLAAGLKVSQNKTLPLRQTKG